MSVEIAGGQDSMSVDALADWREHNTPHVLLDVRELHELAVCDVAGAIHIPMGEVPAKIGDLPQDVPLVVMCHHGMRSMRVVQYLRQAGWANAINLEGGIDAWAEQVDTRVPRY